MQCNMVLGPDGRLPIGLNIEIEMVSDLFVSLFGSATPGTLVALNISITSNIAIIDLHKTSTSVPAT